MPAPPFASRALQEQENDFSKQHAVGQNSSNVFSIPVAPLGDPTVVETVEEKGGGDELISTLSRRIQELDQKNRSLEAELKRALARNTVLENMLKKTLEPVGDIDDEEGSENH